MWENCNDPTTLVPYDYVTDAEIYYESFLYSCGKFKKASFYDELYVFMLTWNLFLYDWHRLY